MERGTIFHLPVTVVRPEPVVDQRWQATLPLEAGAIERKFFAVPQGATWADLRLRSVDADAKRLIVLQTQQLLPGRGTGEDVYEKYISMDPGEVSVHGFKVAGGRTLEIALAQYWSSLGKGTFEAEVVFHGLVPSSEVVRLDGAGIMGTVDVTVPFGRERLKPVVKLTTLRKVVRPSSFVLTPGEAERDMLTRGRLIQEAVLEYRFKLADDARVKPRAFQSLYEDIYESWSSALWMVFDENKRRVGKGPLSGDKTVSLKKGRYVVRVHMRHEDPKRLEMAKHAPLYLDIKLSKRPSVGIHASGEAVLAGSPSFATREVQAGERVRLYLKPPARKDMGKLAEEGDLLFGEIRYGEEVEEKFGQGRRPGGWPIWVLVPEAVPASESETKSDDEEPTKGKPSAYARFQEELLTVKLEKLAELRAAKEDAAFDALAAALLAERRGFVPVLLEQLRRQDREAAPKQSARTRARVIAAADRLMARVDPKRLAEHRGSGTTPKTATEKQTHRRMEMRRRAYAEALHRKARALSHGGEKAKKAFLATWAELRKWTDVESSVYLDTFIRVERARGRTARALQAVQAKLRKYPRKRSLHELRIELLEALGWTHWVAHERAWLSLRFPQAYPPF